MEDTENMRLKDFIYMNNNSISHELCLDIIKMFEEENGKYEGVTYGGLDKNIKDTTDLIIPTCNKKWDKITKFLDIEIKNNLKKYLDSLNDNIDYQNKDQNTLNKYRIFENTNFLHANYMLQRYLKGKGRYIYHNDFSVNSENKSYRAITFLWYLNDVDEGGETVFFGDFKIKPKTGTLIFFPASWCYPHTGKIPLSSNKYIITGWLYVNY
jgi:hypothetical protein